jgi:hypothetical protein
MTSFKLFSIHKGANEIRLKIGESDGCSGKDVRLKFSRKNEACTTSYKNNFHRGETLIWSGSELDICGTDLIFDYHTSVHVEALNISEKFCPRGVTVDRKIDSLVLIARINDGTVNGGFHVRNQIASKLQMKGPPGKFEQLKHFQKLHVF